jgi:hypothetical protein
LHGDKDGEHSTFVRLPALGGGLYQVLIRETDLAVGIDVRIEAVTVSPVEGALDDRGVSNCHIRMSYLQIECFVRCLKKKS